MLLRLGEAYAGLTICEDIWQPGPPATDLALAGAQLLVNLSASPFHVGKAEEREEMLVTRARDTSSYLAFCNLVGGQDELVFDGHSVVLDDAGEVVARAPGFEEHLLVVDVEPELAVGRRLRDVRRRELDRSRETVPRVEVVDLGAPRQRGGRGARGSVAPFAPELEQMRLGLVLGLRDYVGKNGFSDVVVGVSGGIDSAVTAALCVEALGAEHVHCVSMPSRFSSEGTRSDAARLAENLGADFREIPIEATSRRSTRRCASRRTAGSEGLAAENLQARVARRAADGALEHLRLARRLDREQVGARGRLLDAVRRHGRRVRAAEGRVQDRRLPPRAPPERARRPRAGPGEHDRAGAERGAAARTSATPTRSRRTTSSIPCWRRTSSSTAPARSCSRSSTRTSSSR